MGSSAKRAKLILSVYDWYIMPTSANKSHS